MFLAQMLKRLLQHNRHEGEVNARLLRGRLSGGKPDSFVAHIEFWSIMTHTGHADGILRGSLRLSAGRLDHLAPLLGFFGDELTEVGGRAPKRHAAHLSKSCL